MARLILALFLFAVLALAVTAALTLARTVREPPSPSNGREVAMPNGVRAVSYVVLMFLLLGVTSGLLGPG